MLDTTTSVSTEGITSGNYKKKMIEVALPLQAINTASAREKSIRVGHPSTLHLWWARRPLAACRAVIFASLVDDPSAHPERFPTVEAQEKERKRLFGLLEELVQWESSLNESVLLRARAEIRNSLGDYLPTIYDPFCGGGAIPIEAQRLGLPTIASDLNPVAVVITKALTEIPYRFGRHRPIHPSLQGPLSQRTWERATGLAADVEAYGSWMIEEARRRIGGFYPRIKLENGRDASVVAWLWARTVRCNNPVCGAELPLIKSLALSTKTKKEWSIEPIVDRERKVVRFSVRAGKPSRAGTINRSGGECLVCNEPVTLEYIRGEGKAKRLGVVMLAIVAEGENERLYLVPDETQVGVAASAEATWAPDTDLPLHALGFRVQGYGMTKHRDLFTSRQLLTLTTVSDLVKEVHGRALADAQEAGLTSDGISLESGGSGARAYADAIATYLALVVDRLADYNSNLCTWHTGGKNSGNKVVHVFKTQTLSMTWDFAEANALGDSTGGIVGALEWVVKSLAGASAAGEAKVSQRNAARDDYPSAVTCTDPPYYDNVPYADLSDFFYVWLRSSLSTVSPELFATLLVPKAEELVADPARFGGNKERARSFFEQGLSSVFASIARAERANLPTSVFYAFKQSDDEVSDEGTPAILTASVGWEAMLSGLILSGLQIVGTWPMRSELSSRMRGLNSNALASSIVLVCRPRVGAVQCSRAEFVRQVRLELPVAVQRLREASIAATDLQQAALGPGMAVFSRYERVLEVDDSEMSVRSALALINDELTQILLGEIGDVDAETHFALSWFDEHGYTGGSYGIAEILLKAKNARIDQLVQAGVASSDAGRVRLLSPQDITPTKKADLRNYPAWGQTMHLVAALVGREGSDETAADVLRSIGLGSAEHIKDIAYHCYLVCDRTKRLSEARDFNAVAQAWPDLVRLASERGGDTLL